MAVKKNKKEFTGDTKEHIQAVAMDLFKEYGYDDTSIPMICEKAGISKTTLHYYFPKKQDLFFDMNNNFEELYNASFHRIVEQDTFTKQIWEVFKIMCEGDLDYGHSVSQRYFIQRLSEHSQRDFIQNIYHKKMLTAFIRSAQKAGQMLNTGDPVKLAEVLSFSLRGIILTWAIEDGTMDLLSQAKEAVSLIIMPAPGYEI